MGGDVSKRVIFWCGWLDPQIVAVSKEMFQLMSAFPESMAFGVSPHHRLAFDRKRRLYGLHQSAYPVVRWLLPALERRFDLNHVYTSLADWHFLDMLGRRPIVLTATQRGAPENTHLLSKVDHVIAESEPLAADAERLGIPPGKVSVIYPGVDLDVFRETPPPPSADRWKCVFASSPENLSEVHTKGLDLLLELARRDPTFDLTVLWRPFSRRSDETLREVRSRCGDNVHIHAGRVSNIQSFYEAAHFLVAPFRNVGKPAPNSVLEGLAVGRPALVSESVDIAGLLERAGAAVRFECSIDGIQQAFAVMKRDYQSLQPNCRPLAREHFDLEVMTRRVGEVYDRVLAKGADGAHRDRNRSTTTYTVLV
jgi:glycosyltransferase involved in cell wall biosynthesis